MKKKTLAAILTVIIAVAASASFIVNSQFSGLKTKVNLLENQNSELQTQNGTLQEQLKQLKQQFNEQQDRAGDLTSQLALERHLRVEITNGYCSKGWHAYGGLAVSFPANVTIVNNDVVSLFGLSATFQFIDKDSGNPIGESTITKINRVDAGETRVVNGGVLAILTKSGGTTADNAVCKITISKGSIILDEITVELT